MQPPRVGKLQPSVAKTEWAFVIFISLVAKAPTVEVRIHLPFLKERNAGANGVKGTIRLTLQPGVAIFAPGQQREGS
ncbi:hypothetical protein RSK20926_05397 [Roseobacter sp. SK209-2-6]|nr:hypothetical protein RSK20926_05397 [Roseobacter sp. SK209-2-6]